MVFVVLGAGFVTLVVVAAAVVVVVVFVVGVGVTLVVLLTLGLLSVVATGFVLFVVDLGAGLTSGAGSVLAAGFFSAGGAVLLPVAALIMAATGSEAGVATGLAVSLVALFAAGAVSVMLLLPVNAPTPSPAPSPPVLALVLLAAAGSIGCAGAPYSGVLGSAA